MEVPLVLAGFGAFLVVAFVVTLAEPLLFVAVFCLMAVWKLYGPLGLETLRPLALYSTTTH